MSERVLGIGGVFVRARDPERLRAWYAEHLGVELEPFGAAVFRAEAGDITVWHLSAEGEEHFGPPAQRAMINYRVADLHAMLAQLRAAGIAVDENVVDDETGRFGWVVDPEGNRVELWQPNP